MKIKSLALLVVLLWGAFSAVAVAVPATTAPTVRSAPRVEVFPFTAISGTAPGDWTGRGIQEELQSDVSRTGATLVLAAQGAAVGDDPLATARQNHADLAVTGSYQVVGDQIRANGHLIELATNNTVGGFSATGSERDLFKVEDALGEQLRALLPRPISAEEIQRAFEQPQQPVISQEYQTVTPVYSPPPTVNYYYDAAPVQGYYYPDYGYDYPYGVGVYGGFGFSYGYYGGYRGDRGRFDHRGFTEHPSFFSNPGFSGNGFRGGVSGGRSFGSVGTRSGGFGGGHIGGGSAHLGGGRR